MAPHRQNADYVLTAGRNNYPLSLMVEPAAELRVILSYARERFAHDAVARLLGYYRTLLRTMVEQPEVCLAELSPLSEAERSRILRDSNIPAMLVDAECIHERIERVAHEQPDTTAVVYEEQSLTYGELETQVDRLARYLQKLGIGPDMRVGLCVERSLDLIVGLLGVLKAGGAYVALDPKLPKERLAFMLSDSGARVVLLQAGSGVLFSDSDVRQVYLDGDWSEISAPADQPLRREVRPENLAYVIYTSGSTGRPKGVAVEHRQVVNYVSGLLDRLSLDEEISFATVSTVAADLGNTSIFGSLCSGRTLHVLSVDRGFDPDAVAEYMTAHRIDVLKIVPSHLVGLLEAGRPEQVLPRRYLILGGEVVHSSLLERIRTHAPNCQIINHYGPTETTIGVLTHRIDSGLEPHAAVPIGRPLANSSSYILNEDGQPTPVGVSGELYIGGDGLARGYLARPDLTAERFVPDPFGKRAGGRLYRTGDRARYRSDGAVEFQGRTDNQVKVRGFRIELGEIEAQLRSDDRLKDAVVVVRPAADGTKQLAAYIVAASDLDLDSVRTRLAVQVPEYMIPSTMTVLDALPLTVNGKIDRGALPDPEQAQTHQTCAYVAPRNEIETTLAKIWAEVLHVDRVSIHDNFFDLGGDSIRSLQIVAKAYRAGLKVSPKLMFDHHTVAAIVADLGVQTAISREESLLPDIGRGNPFALAGIEKSRLDSVLAKFGNTIEDVYPTSPMQQGMLLPLLQKESAGLYHNQLTYRVAKDFDEHAFKRAWQRTVDRHAILRTGFLWDLVPEPLQIVFRSAAIPIEQQDWRGISDESERENALRQYLRLDRMRGFNPLQPPLMRLCVMHMTDQTWCVVWSLHHVILDGWCQAMLLSEVLTTYHSLRGDQSSEIEPAPSFRNYIQWLAQQDMKAAEKFWRHYLHSFHTPTRLIYTTEPRQDHDRSYGERRVELAIDKTASLHRFAQNARVTVNTVIQATWGILLSRYSGEQDVLFGVTVSGRPADLSDGDTILGLFINTLPLRLRVKPEVTFADWLREVQAINLDLRKYEYSPLMQVQGWSGIKRGTSLFDSLLVFQNYVIDDVIDQHRQEFGIQAVDGEEGWTDYPLTVTVVPDERLSLIFSYDKQRINDRTVKLLSEHWTKLLDDIVSRPGSRLAELTLISASERQQLVTNWNATEQSYPSNCLHELFERQVARTPDALAVSFEEVSLTYSEVNARANRLARVLREEGIGPDVLVGLCLERSHDLLIAMLGIMKAGGAYVPLDPAYPKDRLRYMLRDSQTPIVLTHRDLLNPTEFTGVRRFDMDDRERTANSSDENLLISHSPDHLAYAIYTSGSTGKPKGVMIRHRSVVNFLVSMIETLRPRSDDVFAATTSVSFDIAVLELFLPLLIGARTHLVSREVVIDGPKLSVELEGAGATIMQATPSGWRSLRSAAQIPTLKVLCGGEAFPRELAQEFLANQLQPYNLYGPTETTVWSTMALVTGVDDGIPLGRPLANTQVYLLDSSLMLVPIGVPGELYIGGDGLARGYWQKPDLTAERFVPNPFSATPGSRLYRTGDLACYRVNGTLEFLGRVDNQVKIRGYRIELGEIEACINRCSQIDHSVVVAREFLGDTRLIAYVTRTAGSILTSEEIKRAIQMDLPDYMMPSAIVPLEAFPLTPNGKIDRQALPAPDSPQLGARAGNLRTPTEEIVADLWSTLLAVGRPGASDDFFELGGHSLLAMQVLSHVRTVFKTELPLRSLLEHPTVREFSAAIDRALGTKKDDCRPALLPIKRTAFLPVSFAQQRLWFLWQLAPDSPMYNIPVALHITGELDESALRRSFQELVRRHETLRTTFPLHEGRPSQVIAAEPTDSLTVVDFRDRPADERETLIGSLRRDEARYQFNLQIGPLLRVCLVRIGEQEHMLLVTMHHIVSDGWSMGVLIDEMTKLYSGFITGRPTSLPLPSIQYADYAVWERTWADGGGLETQLAYWQRQLNNVPILALPTDKPRPMVQTYHGTTHSLSLPAAAVDRLKFLGKTSRTTLFMTLLAVTNVLLKYETGNQDIVVGTDVSNRHSVELEELIGFFVNQIALRTTIQGNMRFQDLLVQVREITLAAHARQDVPFDMLVASLLTNRDLRYSPLFQVKLILQNLPAPFMPPSGLQLTVLDNEKVTAELDLLINFEETPEGLNGRFEYNRDLFDPTTVARLARNFIAIVEDVGIHPDTTIEQLEHLLAEKDRILRSEASEARHEANSRALKSVKRRVVGPTL